MAGAEAVEEFGEQGAVVVGGAGLVGANEEDDVEAGGVVGLGGAEGFAESASDGVAEDGGADLFGNGESEAGWGWVWGWAGGVGGECEGDEWVEGFAVAAVEVGFEACGGAGAAEAEAFGEAVGGGCGWWVGGHGVGMVVEAMVVAAGGVRAGESVGSVWGRGVGKGGRSGALDAEDGDVVGGDSAGAVGGDGGAEG